MIVVKKVVEYAMNTCHSLGTIVYNLSQVLKIGW